MATGSDVELTELTYGSDGSNCESDDLSTTPEPARPSILERLRAPQASVLARKRKIATNPPRGKRRSQGSSASSSDPKSVRPDQRVKDYPAETFIVSCGNLFCHACRERLCLKKSSIKNHVGSKKHLEGKIKLQSKEAREQDIATALRKYNSEVHPRGETLPESQQIYRIKVVRAFLRAGVPFNKLDNFKELLEETGYRLTDKRFMLDLIPFVLKEEETTSKAMIKDKKLGIIFDGTTRLGEALTIVVRFISEDWKIQQHVIRVQMLAKSLTGEELARELIHVLSVNYSIRPEQLIASMRDRASVNNVAMRTLSVVYPNLLDVGCFAHTLDRVGDNFKVPHISDFFSAWTTLFSHSSKAKLKWREQTGKSMLSYSATRWWSKWEILHQAFLLFGDIELFLKNNPDIGSATRVKLLSFFQDPQKMVLLKLELAALVDWGKPFVTTTYDLEGDGPLAFMCYEKVQAIVTSIKVANTPNINAVARECSQGNSQSQQHHLIAYANSCIQPGLDYFLKQLQSSLKDSFAAFKAARLFCPYKLNMLKPKADDIECLNSFQFLQNSVPDLKAELATYMAKAEGISDMTIDVIEWWKGHEKELPAWAAATKMVMVVQPTSGAAERVFSILNSTFNDQQSNALQDYIEASVMMQYNYRKQSE